MPEFMKNVWLSGGLSGIGIAAGGTDIHRSMGDETNSAGATILLGRDPDQAVMR